MPVEDVTPRTRRSIIWALSLVALACILAEVLLALSDHGSSEALLTIAATAVGGIAGLAVPGGHD